LPAPSDLGVVTIGPRIIWRIFDPDINFGAGQGRIVGFKIHSAEAVVIHFGFVVSSGDEVTFTATNAGKGFHAFGIVASPDDFNNSLWGSEIASPTAPLKAGESGSTTFTAGAPGAYYYICTVPGHASLGMQGSFIVE